MDNPINTDIRDVCAAYGDAVNQRNSELLGSCFTADAVWEAPGVRAVGRDAIVEAIGSIRERFEWLVHLVHGTTVVSRDGGSADVRTYATELTSRKGRRGMFVNLYHDRCVLDGDRWQIAHRGLEVIYQGPPDLSGPLPNERG